MAVVVQSFGAKFQIFYSKMFQLQNEGTEFDADGSCAASEPWEQCPKLRIHDLISGKNFLGDELINCCYVTYHPFPLLNQRRMAVNTTFDAQDVVQNVYFIHRSVIIL